MTIEVNWFQPRLPGSGPRIPGGGSGPLPGGAPVNVDKSAAVAGVAVTYSRSDHKHDIDTAVPVNVGLVNAEGDSTELARANHVHAFDPAGILGFRAEVTVPLDAGVISVLDLEPEFPIASFAGWHASAVLVTADGTPLVQATLREETFGPGNWSINVSLNTGGAGVPETTWRILMLPPQALVP